MHSKSTSEACSFRAIAPPTGSRQRVLLSKSTAIDRSLYQFAELLFIYDFNSLTR
jgi:hypothetical protein